MRPAQITAVSATGDITTASTNLLAVYLTAGADAATVVVKAGGSSGTTILKLAATAGDSVGGPLGGAALCSGGIHATVTGTSPSVTFVYG